MTLYREYITSDEWKEFRERYYQTHKKECRACGSRRKVCLHHKTYNRLGYERMADVVPLCDNCHSLLHKKIRKEGLNLWKATEDFIRTRRKIKKNRKTVKRNGTKRKSNPRQYKSRRGKANNTRSRNA